ncbi:unnamed protein product [Microthlaspi erraticum]|uniref:Uncharacterized protein n=1 Tax=Microthlaspi erraticum TaxID=1685480 RepID=A0A6D2HKB3_9BRAS|nr:unnamed protein product [Microthlaspi erraticum]
MKVGETTLRSGGEILHLASQVADKCCGHLLALNVIGKTMACKKTVQEWKHALDVMTSDAAEFWGMDVTILHVLKYSGKSCFIHLAIHPSHLKNTIESLIFQFISQGYIDSRGISSVLQYRKNCVLHAPELCCI